MDNKNPEQQGQQINIELTDEVANGQYANLAFVAHSNSEFILDFVNLMPGVPNTKVRSRIIMNPFHAKRLMRVLIDNIKAFENANGVIKEQEGNQVNIPLTFNGPTGQA